MSKRTTAQLVAEKNLAQIKNGERNPVFLILDNIRSMYNVGAIFRTADAARVKKIFLCGITATPVRKEIGKTALKTVDFVPWEHRENAKDLILELNKKGVQTVALEQTTESKNYKNFEFQKPLAIIVGHEVEGVSDDLLDICDVSIEIPMYGIANSLNVATAVGIILFHLL